VEQEYKLKEEIEVCFTDQLLVLIWTWNRTDAHWMSRSDVECGSNRSHWVLHLGSYSNCRKYSCWPPVDLPFLICTSFVNSCTHMWLSQAILVKKTIWVYYYGSLHIQYW
jgi:hypothetical protein